MGSGTSLEIVSCPGKILEFSGSNGVETLFEMRLMFVCGRDVKNGIRYIPRNSFMSWKSPAIFGE